MAGWWRSFWTYFFIIFVTIIAIIITFITTFIDQMFEDRPVFYPPVAVVPAGDMGGGFLDTGSIILPFFFALVAAGLTTQWLYNYLFGPRSRVKRRKVVPPRDAGDSGLGAGGDNGLGAGDGDDDSSSSAASIERALREEQRDNRDWAKSRHPIVGAHIAFHPPEKIEGPRKSFAPIKKPPQGQKKMYLKPSSIPRELSSTLVGRQIGRIKKVGPMYLHSRYLRERAKRSKARRAKQVARKARRVHALGRLHRRLKSQETSLSSRPPIDRESRASDCGCVHAHDLVEEDFFKIPTSSHHGNIEVSPEYGDLALPCRHHHRLVDIHRRDPTHAIRGEESQVVWEDKHLEVPSPANADLPHHCHRHHRGLVDAQAIHRFKDTIDGQKASDSIHASIPSTALNDYHSYGHYDVIDTDHGVGIPHRDRAQIHDKTHVKLSSGHVDLDGCSLPHEHHHERDNHILGARARLEKHTAEKKIKKERKRRKKRMKKRS